MEDNLPSPRSRVHQIGQASIEADLRRTMGEGALSHGWIISGPPGIGKATLAFRIARGVLDPGSLETKTSFDVSTASRVFRLIAASAHPDLFVAERLWDEKKNRYQTEIPVETIRKLTHFLSRTASFGGWRVAIIDTADDMNRNAANAILKVLEEPPAKTLLLLLSAHPGRLLATIRSRCRTLTLPAVPDETIKKFLADEGITQTLSAEATAFIAGRPGFALTLAQEGGAQGVKIARDFLSAVAAGRDTSRFVGALTARGSENIWSVFTEALNFFLMSETRRVAIGRDSQLGANISSAHSLHRAWTTQSALISRGEGLNLDKGQILFALSHDLQDIFRSTGAR